MLVIGLSLVAASAAASRLGAAEDACSVVMSVGFILISAGLVAWLFDAR